MASKCSAEGCTTAFRDPQGPAERWVLPPGPLARVGLVHLKCLSSEGQEDIVREHAFKRIIPISLMVGLLAGWGGMRLFSSPSLKVVGATGGLTAAGGATFLTSSFVLYMWHRAHYATTSK